VSSTNGLIPYINVKLALLGFAAVAGDEAARLSDVVSSLIAQYRQKERLLANPRAFRLGRYLSCSMARRIRARVAPRTRGSLLITLDTVFGETFARSAT